MTHPQRSASPSETPETPALHALPAPRLPRPGELTPELSALICEIVQFEGISDASAGALVGVPSATLARWKAENGNFAQALETARARFELELVRAIRAARKRDGSLDWRALVWVLQHTSAEGLIKPARQAKTRPVQPATAAAQNSANRPETPAAPPVGNARENAPSVPETPAKPRAALAPTAPLPGERVSDDEQATILPETRKAQAAVA